MASIRILHSYGHLWLERHDKLLDGVLILLGTLIALLAYTPIPEW